MPKWLPTQSEILREAVIVLAGAALAAVVVKYVLPAGARDFFTLNDSK